MVAPKKTPAVPPEDRLAQLLAVLEARTKLLAFFFGLCFVAALLVLAVWFPQPTAFQYTVFRIVLALAAAGIAGVIPGMIRLKAQPGAALLIHAGGALAVFVMVYLLAPAALKPEEKPAPPSPSQPRKEKKPAPAKQPLKINGMDALENALQNEQAALSSSPSKEKPVDLQTLKISNVDAIEDSLHVLNFTPPGTRHTARLSNISDAPVHVSLVGFPEKYFYINLADEKSLIQAHDDKEVSVVLMLKLPAPEKKEYIFDIKDSAGGTVRIAIRLNGWKEYISHQIQKIVDKNSQGANTAELYNIAKQIILASGYKELSAPLQEVFAGQLLAAADQPEAAALAYAKAKKEAPEIVERFIANLSPFIKNILADAGKKKSNTTKIIENDTRKINKGSCNKSEYDKAEYFSIKAGKKIVDQFGGGRDVRVKLTSCEYNLHDKKIITEIEIYWNGAMFRKNKYHVDGKLTMDTEGESSSFVKTYANEKARELTFINMAAGSAFVLGIIPSDKSELKDTTDKQ